MQISAGQHTENPDDYLGKGVALRRVVEVQDARKNHVHVSHFPKPNQPNKFRLILDLSGASVNDAQSLFNEVCFSRYGSRKDS